MNLIFITNSFPYYPGEQFIESELPYLEKSSFAPITILPLSAVGEPRLCSERFNVDTTLADNKSIFKYAVKALFSPLFLSELDYLRIKKILCRGTAIQALKAVVLTIRLSDGLSAWVKKNGTIDTAYVYWNDVAAYAACLAKQKNLVGKVVSRSHRYDAYEEHRPYGYMPLKRQFLDSFDKIFMLSTQAKNYYQARYGFHQKFLEISPLGVLVPFSMSNVTPDGELHLVSVSFCVPIKRIDKIVDSVCLFALERPDLKIHWTHIGDGALKESLAARAKRIFLELSNVSFKFEGGMENSDVVRFYKERAVDLFINVSESEGIPVSIMEAMAAGVPAVASSVGGVPDLVNAENGYLLSSDPTLEEIKVALNQMVVKAKKTEIRRSARDQVLGNFNAEVNYQRFIARLESI